MIKEPLLSRVAVFCCTVLRLAYAEAATERSGSSLLLRMDVGQFGVSLPLPLRYALVYRVLLRLGFTSWLPVVYADAHRPICFIVGVGLLLCHLLDPPLVQLAALMYVAVGLRREMTVAGDAVVGTQTCLFWIQFRRVLELGPFGWVGVVGMDLVSVQLASPGPSGSRDVSSCVVVAFVADATHDQWPTGE